MLLNKVVWMIPIEESKMNRATALSREVNEEIAQFQASENFSRAFVNRRVPLVESLIKKKRLE